MASARIQCLLIVCVVGTSLSPRTQAVQSSQPQSADEQDRLLASMREYAQQYVSNLPNFMCVQVTHQFEAGKKQTRWRKGDTLTAKLVFSNGREERSLERVNDRPVERGSWRWRAPLSTEGEFGILLGTVFGSMSRASFVWNRWDMVRGRRVAVFDYSIDKEHSTLKLSLGDVAAAVIPYHGSIYADASTGAIWRITNGASELPPELQTDSISTAVDYDEVAIGGSTYLLPVEAAVYLTTHSRGIRNVIEFTNYRKFEAESKITYVPGATDSQPKKQRDH